MNLSKANNAHPLTEVRKALKGAELHRQVLSASNLPACAVRRGRARRYAVTLIPSDKVICGTATVQEGGVTVSSSVGVRARPEYPA
ncbi:hypothetical protein J6590_043473 [Homalodisca vitripennis]|nr:hypothetical protein J6590_043473 [Homalodisca vitripennis]